MTPSHQIIELIMAMLNQAYRDRSLLGQTAYHDRITDMVITMDDSV